MYLPDEPVGKTKALGNFRIKGTAPATHDRRQSYPCNDTFAALVKKLRCCVKTAV